MHEVIIYVHNDITNEQIHKFFTDHPLVPNVNDTISLNNIGDFVVARREFGYSYDNEYGYEAYNKGKALSYVYNYSVTFRGGTIYVGKNFKYSGWLCKYASRIF